MATKLEKPLRREFPVNEELYTLTISPEGLKLVPKGKRKGHELTWKDLRCFGTRLATRPLLRPRRPAVRVRRSDPRHER
jgi:hypothetical protein